MPREPNAVDRIIPLTGGGSLWVHDVAGPCHDAPALLLVHGLGVTAHLTWRRCYEPLSRHFRVLAFDLHGHGRGPRAGSFSLEVCASHALELLTTLRVPPAIIAGYSLGGSVAKLAWRRAPGRVLGLVLAATASDFAPRHGLRT